MTVYSVITHTHTHTHMQITPVYNCIIDKMYILPVCIRGRRNEIRRIEILDVNIRIMNDTAVRKSRVVR